MAMAAAVPRYTIDMLDALPDSPGVRYELVDGFLIVTPAPGTAHAVVAGRLVTILRSVIPESVAWVAPPGELRIGTSTRLEPDILVYPRRFAPGTPWADVTEWLLAVEIVSPSSAIYDRDHKRRAYLALGVREYWVVDPVARTIDVWHPGDAEPAIVRDVLWYVPPDGRRRISVGVGSVFRDMPVGPDF